eukprot:scaffold742_cov263-Pinguiococcus_pyrenoidosus.AAC.8
MQDASKHGARELYFGYPTDGERLVAYRDRLRRGVLPVALVVLRENRSATFVMSLSQCRPWRMPCCCTTCRPSLDRPRSRRSSLALSMAFARWRRTSCRAWVLEEIDIEKLKWIQSLMRDLAFPPKNSTCAGAGLRECAVGRGRARGLSHRGAPDDPPDPQGESQRCGRARHGRSHCPQSGGEGGPRGRLVFLSSLSLSLSSSPAASSYSFFCSVSTSSMAA